MGEERSAENKAIKKIIQNAKTIIVIGFSFDPANLAKIGFPTTRTDMIEFMKNKKLKYLNFNGEMKNLDTELMSLNNKSTNTVVINSTSRYISDAYINSFRSYFS